VTVVVTSTDDTLTRCATTSVPAVPDGVCTLRDAITFSNAHPQLPLIQNLIQFNIPGSGVQTITLGSNLPAITTATIIDGYSQPGASPNTLAIGDNAVLKIFLFNQDNNIEYFLDITGGDGSVVRGLALGADVPGFLLEPDGILLNSCCNTIAGNFIGTDPSDNAFLSAALIVASSSNVIGGRALADRNVVNGAVCGGSEGCFPEDSLALVRIDGNDNVVQGNYIGLNAAGTSSKTHGDGIEILGARNTIGGALLSTGNVISGTHFGIILETIGAVDNGIGSNLIGTDAAGLSPIGNEVGIFFGFFAGAQRNLIGTFSTPTTIVGGPNLIAFNGGPGIWMCGPCNGSGDVRRNSILGNSIFANGGLGIDLGTLITQVSTGPDGVTLNDLGDGDSGPNDLQNFPVLTSVKSGIAKTEVQGTLNSLPEADYRIQFFSNSACDSSGFGQGETFLGETFVTTDASGDTSFDVTLGVGSLTGQFITATATDSAGNTSEFSACIEEGGRRRLTRTRFLVEGPIRVLPGVPVQFPVRVEAVREAPVAPSGIVLVSAGPGLECRAELSRAGEGSCQLTFPSEAAYRVRAHYEGNDSFAASTSPALQVVVKQRSGGG
jgi:CSLREA domain-containing protein